MNPRLLGIAGPFQGTAFSLQERNVSIGRESSNDLWIGDPALSRRHCLPLPQGGQCAVRDLGSRNGTLVNGVPVEEQLLRNGDHISVGDSVLIFLREEGGSRLAQNSIEFNETEEIEGSTVVLRPEDALYLRSVENL